VRGIAPITLGKRLATIAGLVIAVVMGWQAQADDNEPRERVILMRSGRVLTGMATRNAGGWLVEQGNGRVQVPEDQVSFVANNLIDAYRKQRDSVVQPTPATHMSLAQWCISYRLHHEARDELRKCLKLDPEDAAARKLLRRIDDMLDPVEVKPPAERSPFRTSAGFAIPEAESLGGLPIDIAVQFTQRVQPLLINKCGTTSCHGVATSTQKVEGFHLVPVRQGSNSHRMYTERNLAEVLRYVDQKEPSLSPLLTLPQGTHGGTSGVFHGTTGNSQMKMLRTWIKAVAQEKQADDEVQAVRPTILAKAASRAVQAQIPVATEESTVESSEELPVRNRTMAATPNTSPAIRPTTPRTQPADPSPLELKSQPDEARLDKPVNDPFDPDVFNRRYHSPPRR
jgi:hypothetical protein